MVIRRQQPEHVVVQTAAVVDDLQQAFESGAVEVRDHADEALCPLPRARRIGARGGDRLDQPVDAIA